MPLEGIAPLKNALTARPPRQIDQTVDAGPAPQLRYGSAMRSSAESNSVQTVELLRRREGLLTVFRVID